MRALLFLSFILSGSLFAGSVRMINDTSFPLTAVVNGADGSKKGSISIPAQGSATWQDSAGGTYAWSQTPYRVTFTCAKTGKQYGVIDGVQQAATIRASMASGTRDCSQYKKDQKNQESPQVQQHSGDPDLGPPQGNINPSGAVTPNASSGGGQSHGNEPPGDPIWGPP